MPFFCILKVLCSSIHPFIQYIFIGHLVCARLFARQWIQLHTRKVYPSQSLQTQYPGNQWLLRRYKVGGIRDYGRDGVRGVLVNVSQEALGGTWKAVICGIWQFLRMETLNKAYYNDYFDITECKEEMQTVSWASSVGLQYTIGWSRK